ncbi:hypothetical protein GCM10009733_020050 [Nonomuraea maheshkhaliensis]|uniref:IS256 family transposase n=1 Tax=Nonomuraea maheshkhaliensis TaxID=419590 RepID=A0ABP4QVM8_9ACTN
MQALRDAVHRTVIDHVERLRVTDPRTLAQEEGQQVLARSPERSIKTAYEPTLGEGYDRQQIT